MKIYRFGADDAQKLDNFGSDFIFSKIVRINVDVRVSCFHLGPNGKVGYHQTLTPQLFLVVRGSGWARDEISEHIPIAMDQAVFWDQNEWHEVGTNTGLTAILIESESLNPSEFMPLEWDGS